MAFNDLTITNPFAVTTSTVQTTAPATTPAVVTVPVVAATPATTTPTGTTAPTSTTAPLPLVSKTADKNVGLGVEKNPTTTEKKTGEMDAFFSRYYTKYKNADAEGKKHFANRYLTSMAKNPAKQAAEFERLRKAGVSPDEIKILAGTIENLNAKNQYKAADSVINKGTKEQNHVGAEVVAKNYSHYDKIAQKPTAEALVKTNDTEIIKTAASHACETDKSNQTDIVKTFQSVDNIDVNKILIDQYGKYAKENEVGIHTIMSASKHSETVEYAASNIWHFDKTNQAQAVQITTNTGNEKAINAAAAQYDKYDESARAQIKETINNSGYDSAKSTLSAAEEKAQTEAQNANDTKTTSNEKTSSNKIKDIINSNELNKDTLIKEAFRNATPAEKATWIETLSPNELANMINIIPLNELSSDVLGKVLRLMDSADSKSQKELVERINATSISDILGTQLSTTGGNIQNIYMEKAVKSGKTINKNLLSLAVRQNYNELLKEQNKV